MSRASRSCFFPSRGRHTRFDCDWSPDVCSSDLDAMTKLVDIDAQFAKVTKGWLNPESEIAAMLFIRCHGAYRTACGLAMSGQAAECYVQCRSVLEYAAYAVHINRNASLGKVWLDRHQDDAGMKASKRAFQHVAVSKSV